MINEIIITIVLLYSSILIHELGHFLYFKWVIGKNVDVLFTRDEKTKNYFFQVGYPGDYKGLTKGQMASLYISGIVAGLIPFVFVSVINYWYFALLPLYLLGCIPDMKNLINLGGE